MHTERPHCFTIRELLLLVATVEEAQRVAYLEKVFGWFFERTRSMAVAVGGGAIAISVAVSSAAGGKNLLTIVIAALAVAVLILTTLWINYVLVPLHREYLDCNALLRGIGDFEHELRARLVSDGRPESNVCVTWHSRTGRWGRERFANELCRSVRAWQVNDPERPSEEIGRYLLKILGPIPTDQYERNPKVQEVVDHCLKCASRAKAAADSALPGSKPWYEILRECPRSV